MKYSATLIAACIGATIVAAAPTSHHSLLPLDGTSDTESSTPYDEQGLNGRKPLPQITLPSGIKTRIGTTVLHPDTPDAQPLFSREEMEEPEEEYEEEPEEDDSDTMIASRDWDLQTLERRQPVLDRLHRMTTSAQSRIEDVQEVTAAFGPASNTALRLGNGLQAIGNVRARRRGTHGSQQSMAEPGMNDEMGSY